MTQKTKNSMHNNNASMQKQLNQYTAVNNDAPSYDLDGSMLTNGDWNYTWNGENRLVRAENAVTGAALEFDYDYMGRRIYKKVYNGTVLEKHLVFVYDGYKLIEERDALDGGSLVRQYAWQPEVLGRDVPLTVHDAASNATYYYHTDANKNVTELTDESGAVAAHYEYSPFGTVTRITGSFAADNPFRFSSEYSDAETGLVYYNYRYYSPELGRWLSRDPIEELGGYNLYGMLGNNPMLGWDELGMEEHEWWCSANNMKKIFQNTIIFIQDEINQTRNDIDNLKQLHYGRNKYNNVPENLKEIDESFVELPPSKSVFHGIEQGNRKFINKDGREAVYDKNGNLVTDPKTLGTFNYYDPVEDKSNHMLIDVIPYYIWGNSPEDDTSFGGKMKMSLKSFFMTEE